MHPGKTCMDAIDKCTSGVPKLTRNNLHSCKICDEMNIRKHFNKESDDQHVLRFADRFQMDFGFMAGKLDSVIVRSHDGYNCYLLIIDYHTRYTWIFLSKNKAPPLKTIQQFLRTYGNTDGVRLIRTDQGGELARSASFKNTIKTAEYNIEITGADNSSQNGIAERPHQTLADMVRAGLENAGLSPQYWSDALLHAVYIKNRLPHAAFNYKITPYERLTGTTPDLSKLRVFGSRVVCRKPGKRRPKISKHSYNGIFLRYAKTMKNIVYLDLKTRQIKTSTFAKFDEEHFSYESKPPGAKILIEMGMKEMDKTELQPPSNDILNIVKQSPHAIAPQRNSTDAVGYDLHSLDSYVIPSQNVGLIDTGIAVKFPTGTYGRIASRSGLILHNNVTVLGGVIDPDYTGTIKILLYNFSDSTFKVNKNDRIAQLILECYKTTPVNVVDALPPTTRSTKGFGSTGVHVKVAKNTNNNGTHPTNGTYKEANATSLNMIFSKPVFTTSVRLQKQGIHPTLGMQLRNDDQGPRITLCIRGTPASRVPRWRQVLKDATIHAIDDTLITNESDIPQLIRKSTRDEITLHVIPPNPVDIHPDTGVPQLNFDQFLHICDLHQQVLTDTSSTIIQQEKDDSTQIMVNK